MSTRCGRGSATPLFAASPWRLQNRREFAVSAPRANRFGLGFERKRVALLLRQVAVVGARISAVSGLLHEHALPDFPCALLQAGAQFVGVLLRLLRNADND